MLIYFKISKGVKMLDEQTLEVIRSKFPMVITIAHQKGGVGKSTTTANLAVRLSKDFNITVIDADPQQHTKKFNDKRDQPFKVLSPKTSNDLISMIKENKGLTLIDLGGYDSELGRTALFLSEWVFIPVSDSSYELDGLLTFEEKMSKIVKENEDIQCRVLVNRVHHSDKATHKALKSFLEGIKNFEAFETVIPVNKNYKDMLAKGKSITELTSGTPGIIFEKFYNEVINTIKGA